MKVVICWTSISGYMAACWRALAAMDGIEPEVVACKPPIDSPAPFDPRLLDDVPCHLIEKRDLFESPRRVTERLVNLKPDVVVLPGWTIPLYRRLPFKRAMRGVRFVMGMDTPWRDDLRQHLARWRLRAFLKRIDRVMVPGERGWQYARRLGIPPQRIRRGLYGIDYDALRPSLDHRRARPGGWPDRLLFAGRYTSAKGLDVLLDAHERYRAAHAGAFELSCCGRGPMQDRVRANVGVTELGFVQPMQLPQLFSEHGVFVMPSRYDPWPLAIVEACAAGLPVICTEACGSAVELVRPYHNGLIVPTDDASALAAALGWMHAHRNDLPTIGAHGSALAKAYRAQVWAQRWTEMLCELTSSTSTAASQPMAASPESSRTQSIASR